MDLENIEKPAHLLLVTWDGKILPPLIYENRVDALNTIRELIMVQTDSTEDFNQLKLTHPENLILKDLLAYKLPAKWSAEIYNLDEIERIPDLRGYLPF